jgi:phenylalanyl-tRNA synthetase beta chain
MRISLNWLRDYIDITLSPEELAEALTMAGFEVEEIEDRRTWADGVVVGKVLERSPHPNADKLSVCTVDIGADQPSTIVCGAANVRADIFVPVATLGTYLPTIDLKIRPRKLRNVPSEGMICSLTELGLAKESEGIHILTQAGLTPGEDVRPYLGLDDVILDLTSTANRADVLSMIGVARELAAITGNPLRLPEIPESFDHGTQAALSVSLSDGQACPVYIGTAIAQVQIQPSPPWLQQRLEAAGTRPINNVVDITNYVLLEWGQPLHAFDGDRLRAIAGKQNLTLGVRFAHGGETLKTLDGQQRTLEPQNLLITANDQPVALAGVMGGEDTEVHAQTQNLVLEAAIFDPVAIRRSARAQGLRTEASARYERGVNQAELDFACRRALQLLVDLAGGTLDTQVADDRRPPLGIQQAIDLRLERVNQVLGPVDLSKVHGTSMSAQPDETDLGELGAADVERVLTALGCQLEPQAEGVWLVTVPPYRYRDLEREIDLIEEIARLYGYNNFYETLPAKTEPGFLSFEYAALRKIYSTFQAVGLTELIHYSLGKPTQEERQVVLANPLLAEYSALRTALLPGLIDAFQYNLEQGNGPLNGFEVGRVFWRDEDGLNEADAVAGILGGDRRQSRWTTSGQEQPMGWYDAKGILSSVFERLGLSVEYQPDRRNPLLHPGRTASLWLQGQRLGTFGQIHPKVRQERGLPDAIYGFELDLEVLFDQLEREELSTPLFKPFSAYPASARDIAFYASVNTSVAELERAIRKAGGALLETVTLFDEYRGQNVPEGKRSLAFRLVYRAGDRTLTDEEVETTHQKVRDVLMEKFGVEMRS